MCYLLSREDRRWCRSLLLSLRLPLRHTLPGRLRLHARRHRWALDALRLLLHHWGRRLRRTGLLKLLSHFLAVGLFLLLFDPSDQRVESDDRDHDKEPDEAPGAVVVLREDEIDAVDQHDQVREPSLGGLAMASRMFVSACTLRIL